MAAGLLAQVNMRPRKKNVTASFILLLIHNDQSHYLLLIHKDQCVFLALPFSLNN